MASAAVTETSAPEKAARSDLAWILVLAVAARALAAVAYFRVIPLRPLSQWAYEDVNIALALLHGQGFSSPFYFPSGPTAFMTPGYPLLLAVCMRVLGTGIAATIGIIAFQIALSLATVLLVVKVSRRHFGVRTSNLAGLLCAVVEPLLIAPLYIWDTCLSALILLCAVAVAPQIRRRAHFAAAGLLCAFTALINPALLLAMIAIFAWSAWRAQIIPWLGICVFLVAFSPWPIRNYVSMHAFIPLRSTFGYELWKSNQSGSDGDSVTFRDPLTDPAERARFLSHGELGYMGQKDSLAKAWIRTHPREFTALTARRMERFWAGSSKSPVAMTLLLSVMGFIGLLLLWRSRQIFMLFALPLLIYPLPYYITHADLRYQMILEPLLAILAGYACECFFAWCARRPAPSSSLPATVS